MKIFVQFAVIYVKYLMGEPLSAISLCAPLRNLHLHHCRVQMGEQIDLHDWHK